MSLLRRLLIEPARPSRIRDWPKAPWLAVAAVCIGAFMGQLDASIVTLALPSLRHDLHASLAAVEWVSLAYLLVLVATVSAAGRIADMIGRKLVYTYGFVVFTLASLGCGLAPNLAVLLLMRVVQAIGAAMLQANSVALIRTTVAPEQLNRAIGFQGVAQAMGLALGPAVGGVLINIAGWRWVFFVNLPAGVLGVALAVLLLPRTRQRAPQTRFDWPGLATLLPASAGLLLALSLLGRPGQRGLVSVSAVAAIGFAVAFVHVERRRSAPLIDLRLFADSAFSRAVSSGLLAYLVLFGILFVTPLYLEESAGRSPVQAGLLLTVLPLALGLLAPVASLIVVRVGAAATTAGGMVLVFAGLLVATVSTVPAVVVALAAAGAGLGLFTPANNAAVAGSGQVENAGMVSGILNMTRGVGTALGVACAGAAYSLAIGAQAMPAPHLAAHGFRVAMLVLAAAALGAAMLSGFSAFSSFSARSLRRR
jgi:EmrB/QacA subfamily drug resistance transporter